MIASFEALSLSRLLSSDGTPFWEVSSSVSAAFPLVATIGTAATTPLLSGMSFSSSGCESNATLYAHSANSTEWADHFFATAAFSSPSPFSSPAAPLLFPPSHSLFSRSCLACISSTNFKYSLAV
uniref:(northern house mosquito) hypothetical protein n=1 Tax=Culex pipiens TaxID=7175 RepID=A0A8D8N8V9_CULPI